LRVDPRDRPGLCLTRPRARKGGKGSIMSESWKVGDVLDTG
jgi:hypothetical protein